MKSQISLDFMIAFLLFLTFFSWLTYIFASSIQFPLPSSREASDAIKKILYSPGIPPDWENKTKYSQTGEYKDNIIRPGIAGNFYLIPVLINFSQASNWPFGLDISFPENTDFNSIKVYDLNLGLQPSLWDGKVYWEGNTTSIDLFYIFYSLYSNFTKVEPKGLTFNETQPNIFEINNSNNVSFIMEKSLINLTNNNSQVLKITQDSGITFNNDKECNKNSNIEWVVNNSLRRELKVSWSGSGYSIEKRIVFFYNQPFWIEKLKLSVSSNLVTGFKWGVNSSSNTWNKMNYGSGEENIGFLNESLSNTQGWLDCYSSSDNSYDFGFIVTNESDNWPDLYLNVFPHTGGYWIGISTSSNSKFNTGDYYLEMVYVLGNSTKVQEIKNLIEKEIKIKIGKEKPFIALSYEKLERIREFSYDDIRKFFGTKHFDFYLTTQIF